jgi:4-amino-4-deoxy-L-arabinose transferase-like glycosyltransferase
MEKRQAPAVPVEIFVGLIVAFNAIVRLRLLDLPLERDEGEHAYAGQLLLQGIPPYKLVYSQKFPGIYAANALIEALLGQSAEAIRIALIAITSATALLVYLLGARLFGRGAGMAAAAAYVLLSLSLASQGLYAHATHFVMLPAMGAFVLLSRNRMPLLAGVLLGLAVLMKQPGAVFAAFGVLWMLAEKRWRDAGLVAAGGAIVAAIAAIALAAAGIFGRFWFWTVRYASEYGSETTLAEGKVFFMRQFSAIVGWTPALWIAIAAGIVLMLVERSTRRAGVIVVALILFSFLGTSMGLYFRHHYFLLMFPACALAAGGGVAAAMRLLPERARFAAPAAFGVVLLLSVASEWNIVARYTPERVTRILHGDSPFLEAPKIAEYLRDHTASDDRIAIFGSEPEIFFLANRKSATGYIYMYPLMEPQPFARTMQREMMAEVERANPKYIVSVMSPFSWLVRPDSDRTIIEYAQKKVDSGAYQLEMREGVVASFRRAPATAATPP